MMVRRKRHVPRRGGSGSAAAASLGAGKARRHKQEVQRPPAPESVHIPLAGHQTQGVPGGLKSPPRCTHWGRVLFLGGRIARGSPRAPQSREARPLHGTNLALDLPRPASQRRARMAKRGKRETFGRTTGCSAAERWVRFQDFIYQVDIIDEQFNARAAVRGSRLLGKRGRPAMAIASMDAGVPGETRNVQANRNTGVRKSKPLGREDSNASNRSPRRSRGRPARARLLGSPNGVVVRRRADAPAGTRPLSASTPG